MPLVSAVLCTHNPREDYLELTLEALKKQSFPDSAWELLIVDNASAWALKDRIDLSWKHDARIVHEERLGLTHARLRSFREARGEVLICLDDDNVLQHDYLAQALEAMAGDKTLGAIGGKSIPRYEVSPPAWFEELGVSLACRDLGDESLFADWIGAVGEERSYPACAPIGAGMAIRREICQIYASAAHGDGTRTALGRRGADLASGEDNDIVMCILEGGWRIGYFPCLRLQHLIPAARLTPEYLARYTYSSNRTWVQALALHGIYPWPAISAWSLSLRKGKAYLGSRAWASKINYIRWRARCGLLEGQATIAK